VESQPAVAADRKTDERVVTEDYRAKKKRREREEKGTLRKTKTERRGEQVRRATVLGDPSKDQSLLGKVIDKACTLR